MVNNYFYKMVRYFFSLLSILIFGLCLLGKNIENVYRLDISRNNIFIFVFSALAFVLIIIGIRKISSRSEGDKRVLIIVSMLMFIGQVIFIHSYYFKTGWDVNMVISTSERLANGLDIPERTNNYYSLYPNNLFITILFSKITTLSEFLGLGDYSYFILLVIQSGLNVLTGFLMYLILERLLKKQYIAWIGYIFYVLLIWLSPWVSIPYSDSMGLIFPIGLLYLYQSLENKKYNVLKIISMAILVVVGYSIKPQSTIMFIALAIVSLLAINRINIKVVLKNTLIFSFVLSISIFGVRYFVGSSSLNLDKEKEFSYTHFIKMGLNNDSNGGYLYEDVQDSMNSMTKEDRKKENIEKIKERIKDYGVVGLVEHQIKKTLSNYNDGTFAWGLEGGFFKEINEDTSILSKYTKGFYYYEGEHYKYFKYLMQGTWLLILSLLMGNIFKSKKDDSRVVSVVYLSLIGLFIFESIFEARARYLYTYVPIFIIAACIGLENIMNKLKKDESL